MCRCSSSIGKFTIKNVLQSTQASRTHQESRDASVPNKSTRFGTEQLVSSSQKEYIHIIQEAARLEYSFSEAVYISLE